MWHTDSLWLEVAIVTIFFLFGNIYFGHFEERSPKWRKVAKYIVSLAIILLVSHYFGRTAAFILLGLSILPIIYVHGMISGVGIRIFLKIRNSVPTEVSGRSFCPRHQSGH